MALNMKKTCETKEKLLQVGFDLIWDGNYGSVSVDDICKKRAEHQQRQFLSLLSFQGGFSRGGLSRVLEGEASGDGPHFLATSSPFGANPGLVPVGFTQSQKEKAEQYGHVCGCPYASVGSEVATQDEKIRACSEQLMNSSGKYMESAIADAIREGSVTVKDPVAASQTLGSLFLGMLVEARVQNDLKVLEGLESTIMAFLGAKTVPALTT